MSLRWVFFALSVLLAFSAPPAAAEQPNVASAESLYVAGDFAAAEKAFAALQPAADDTLITLRRASLQLLRNDVRAARATLVPLLARPDAPRSAKVMAAESYARALDFAHAAPLERDLGREALAKQMESFAGKQPYRYHGPDRVGVDFVQTDPLPVIQVRVNGKGPYFFLIDTGGSDLLVDPVLADSLGLPRFGEEEGTFGGGRRRSVTKSSVGALGLADATLFDVPASLLDCSPFSAAANGRRIFGVVGTLVLKRMRATLDYPGDALILERRGVAPAAGDSSRHVMRMWLGGDHYVLARGQLDDAPEALWFVDTGLAGAALTAPVSTLAAAGIAVPDTSYGESGMGGGGSMKIQLFGVRRFRLGDVSANGMYGYFGAFPPTLERAFGYRIAGIISHAFLRSWRVTFDFDAMQLVFEPRNSAKP